MSDFKRLLDAPAHTSGILLGNEAFALGVLHAGYHAADGYPGTPSSEVIDTLSTVQDRLIVGWSTNEAVATAVGVGHSIAGNDVVVTMKIPGVMQAGDTITTAAFSTGKAGALVIYAATDLVPSSTQHVIDARYLFRSSRLPVLEPRNHQEMYAFAWLAADISRKFQTPVIFLASGILCHSEGLISTQEPRTLEPREMADLNRYVTIPSSALVNYVTATRERIPAIKHWLPETNLAREIDGHTHWGILTCGESTMVVQEALKTAQQRPSILSLGITNPLPENAIIEWAKKIHGPIFVIEEGDTYLQEHTQLLGIPVIGKEEYSVITNWEPDMVLQFLASHIPLNYNATPSTVNVAPVSRPPGICPGCPYKGFALTIAKLKRQKKLVAAFGDIGCSALLHFLNALDALLCMGASDAMRQGVVLARPELAGKVISVIGDSCECHSGMDASRNAVFRNIPGVKVILNNHLVAMTGGQPAPSSTANLAGDKNRFDLTEAVRSEQIKTRVLDVYNIKDVEQGLLAAMADAENGEFTALILEGDCIQIRSASQKTRQLTIQEENCKSCKACLICPGIEMKEGASTPEYTNLCTNCGSNSVQICKQRCKFGAIVKMDGPKKTKPAVDLSNLAVSITHTKTVSAKLPESLRVAIRGIGGQGNLFFGRVLSQVAQNSPYGKQNILKGDTHGMAQLGGAVISTFSAGEVYSSMPVAQSVDVLVVMETSEILRPGFLELLKPHGTIILNQFQAVPATAKKEDYPDIKAIEATLTPYTVIHIDAVNMALEIGDPTGRLANTIILGLLSTIQPFNAFNQKNWLDALTALSKTPQIKTMNHLAFSTGQNYGGTHKMPGEPQLEPQLVTA